MQLKIIQAELEEAKHVLDSFISDSNNCYAIQEAGMLLTDCLQSGHKIISCGNGGSMCDAMHFAEELTGKYRGDRNPLPALAISDPAYLTCTANDFGYDDVFARFIHGVGTPGDALLAISTSGNSENVVRACSAAKSKGMKIVGLTGKNGGKVAQLSDVNINIPHFRYSDRVQELHIKIIHILIHFIETSLGLDKTV